MEKTAFDPDSYEQDLAVMMLDVLVKKNEISFGTYKTAKKNVLKEEKYGESCTGGATEAAG